MKACCATFDATKIKKIKTMIINMIFMIIMNRYKFFNRDLIHFCPFLPDLLSAEELEASPEIGESCTSRGAADETSQVPE